MTDSATLTHCLVFVNEWAALLCVTFEAGFISSHESKAAGGESLLNICRRPLYRDSLVRVMAIAAAHFAFEHWMMMRQLK